jgi:Golgi SNAP receptor complex protein 1
MAPMQGFVPISGKRQSWEELRKEARTIENQIDVKLVQLSKLGNGIGSAASSSQPSAPSTSDKTPLLDADSGEEVVEDSSHRDILQDYRQEFNKTRSNVASIIERHDLLDSVHKDISDYQRNMSGSQGGPNNRRMELLLKESEHARRSERMVDDQINIAIESRETLMSQRVAFKAIQTKLNDISNRFPLINNLVHKINLRKRRDTIIIGSVIGICFVFLLWYWLG